MEKMKRNRQRTLTTHLNAVSSLEIFLMHCSIQLIGSEETGAHLHGRAFLTRYCKQPNSLSLTLKSHPPDVCTTPTLPWHNVWNMEILHFLAIDSNMRSGLTVRVTFKRTTSIPFSLVAIFLDVELDPNSGQGRKSLRGLDFIIYNHVSTTIYSVLNPNFEARESFSFSPLCLHLFHLALYHTLQPMINIPTLTCWDFLSGWLLCFRLNK